MWLPDTSCWRAAKLGVGGIEKTTTVKNFFFFFFKINGYISGYNGDAQMMGNYHCWKLLSVLPKELKLLVVPVHLNNQNHCKIEESLQVISVDPDH